jgi:hypothetical protein
MVTWTLSCYHVISAYVAEPGASAHRPYWKNEYSKGGKRHLRLHLIWAIATLACAARFLSVC